MIIKNAFCCLWMILHDLVTLPVVEKHLVLSQYVISSRSNRPNSSKWPKTSFLAFWIIQNAFLWSLNDPSWPSNVAERCETFSTITTCNINSIKQTKLQKMTKNLFFGSLDHSKMQYCAFWMTLHDLIMLPYVEKHLVLSQYAIPSRSNRPKSRKWPKTSFLTFWIIQKCIFVIFEWSFMTW